MKKAASSLSAGLYGSSPMYQRTVSRDKKEEGGEETHVAALLGTNSAAAALFAAMTVPPGVCAPLPPSPLATGGPSDTPPGTKTAAAAAEATEKGVEVALLAPTAGEDGRGVEVEGRSWENWQPLSLYLQLP